MKIKKKLLFGFGLLFIVVLIFGTISVYYIKVISETSNITLKNNYKTLTFTRDMRSVLDENDLPLTSGASRTFDQALQKQENNITEPGEKAATDSLRQAFTLLIAPSSILNQKQQAERNARLQLKKIEELNMHAIELKNGYTHSTVSKATLYLGAMVFITFLILFILIVNFPGFILNPLHELTDGLDQVSKKYYDTRLKFNTSDEFTQLAEAFNTMAVSLGEQENADLTKIFAAELRINMLIEEMQDAVLGVNEKQEVLFINHQAKKILNLSGKSVIGQSVLELSKNSQLLKMMLESKDVENPLKIDQDGNVLYFQQKSLEIVVPNLKTDLDTLQVASYPAGTIRVLKQTKG
ncbi:HAMP domain-containing protein [Mucilaginibacter lappiensis]|uniref:histidine kinase n=1 Tax=Mucilaginibacter lappiensis TaxID=354630 RepID=A0A841J6N3_9SPHI|nr:HAMP domain-containing protein [Mucilaginibacter lappiensis]MBB6126703.1 nitrogen fixation/metabolism regulation signal transduction histidine kinase [Mucilaginibacter lappiensis]